MIERMILILLLLAAVGASASPIAPQPQQAPDGMSVYFDLVGDVSCGIIEDWTPGIEAGFTVMAYLLLTFPETEFPSVKAWEAHLEIETNAYLVPVVNLTPGAIDIDPDEDDYVVGCGGTAAIPITGDFTVLATLELRWLGYEGSAGCTITLEGVEDSVSFPAGAGYIPEPGFPIPCTSAWTTWGPCAWIGDYCWDVGNEGMTWGQVKSLY